MTTGIRTEATPFRHVSPLTADFNILLVDDDLAAIRLMGSILSEVGRLRFATNGKDALRLAHELSPDLILLDAEMPGMSGFDLLRTLKAEAALAEVPVIFITSHSGAGFEVSALELGAADFIAKPFRSSPVLARVKAHLHAKQVSDQLRRAASTDSLTGVANRRLFDTLLEREWLLARRADQPLSVLLIDVDHFKLYNDRYGHPQGDVCLRRIANALVDACRRPTDLVARYGGEEFAVLLPRTPGDDAGHVAQRTLAAVAALGIVHESSTTAPHVSISVGMASTQPSFSADGAAELIAAADRALYAAKRAGRARVGI